MFLILIMLIKIKFSAVQCISTHSQNNDDYHHQNNNPHADQNKVFRSEQCNDRQVAAVPALPAPPLPPGVDEQSLFDT